MSVFPQGFGIGVPSKDHPNPYPTLNLLNPPWWYDWGSRSKAARWPTGPWEKKYYPHMYWKPEGHADGKFDYGPNGKAWLYFNEPNQPGQAEITTTEAVNWAWQFWGMGAKRMMVGNIIIDRYRPYCDRLGWLSGYVRKGGPLPEAWAIHCYGWGGAGGDPPTLTGLRAKLARFRQWMDAYRVVRPIVISEINAQGGNLAAQKTLMKATDTVVKSGEVMAAAWFSASYREKQGGEPADLMKGGKLTELGHYYKSL